jgi:ribonuclease R
MRLNEALRELEQSGEIARIRKNRYVLPSEADLVSGTLQVHQAGYGFLSRSEPGEPDLFIAAENTGTAMHGDKVLARITRDEDHARAKGHERAEGRVIRILERAHDSIVGTLQRSKNFFYVVPDDPRIVHDVYVQVPPQPPLPKIPAPGDKVVVRLEIWESRHVNPEGQITEILGRSSDPGVDVLSIIRKYHLPTEFPADVLQEVEKISQTVGREMIEGREDLRDQFIVTIDPDDARTSMMRLTSTGFLVGDGN